MHDDLVQLMFHNEHNAISLIVIVNSIANIRKHLNDSGLVSLCSY